MSRMLQLQAVCSDCLVLSETEFCLQCLVVKPYNYMMIFCGMGSNKKPTGINIVLGGFNLLDIRITSWMESLSVMKVYSSLGHFTLGDFLLVILHTSFCSFLHY